jgi:acyl-CoA dehydrogenase
MMSVCGVAVSEALMRVADRCLQVMGGTGVSAETIVAGFPRNPRLPHL